MKKLVLKPLYGFKKWKTSIVEENRYISYVNEGKAVIPFLTALDDIEYLIINRDLIFVYPIESKTETDIENHLLSKGFSSVETFKDDREGCILKPLLKNNEVTSRLNLKRLYHQSFNIDLVILRKDIVDIAKEVNSLLAVSGIRFDDNETHKMFVEYMVTLIRHRS